MKKQVSMSFFNDELARSHEVPFELFIRRGVSNTPGTNLSAPLQRALKEHGANIVDVLTRGGI